MPSLARHVVLGLLALGAFAPGAVAAAGDPQLRVLSNRADLISGGDALVQVVLPDGAERGNVQVLAGARDVTGAFATQPDGRFVGLVEGLPEGDTRLRAVLGDGRGATLTVTNHPGGGPVTSGPQIQPWKCAAGAQDAQCTRPAKYEFLYKSSAGGGLRAYDPKSPPSDVATTTTDQGKRVPFVVRLEKGTIDRDEYRIAVLYDPARPWNPGAPQPQFNHKLVVFHGASCDTQYNEASAPDVLNETALGRGFATMSTALNNAGHNCNIAVQAEALIMVKERVVERYGDLRYTIGSGCSGGALTQQQVANAYPGVYQGITPACSFPDAWSSAMLYVDYQLLRRYLENPAGYEPGLAWSSDDIEAVEGHPNPVNAVTFNTAIASSGDPSRSCGGVPPEQVYDAKTNPKGVRCSLQDYMVNVFGRRAADGFAGRPYDNVGIEYGRKALEDGVISPAQFADINAKVGAWDIDYNPTAERVAADRPALERVYRSGGVNQGTNLDQVAIIDLRGPDPGAFHDVYRTYVLRARLLREHGTAANQVLWRGQVPLLGDADYTNEAIIAMDGWLAAVEKDTRDVPVARKILEDKPKGLTDRCTDGLPGGMEQSSATCDATVQAYSSARIQAGMPLTDDTIKCELEPLSRDAHRVKFSDAEWAKLVKAFPDGVCDYRRAGVDRTPTVPWLTYEKGPGGQPLGAPPSSAALSGLAAARACTSRRALRITVPRRGRLRSATVFVNGKRSRSLRRAGRGMRRVPVSFGGRRKGTVRVRIVGRTTGGKRVVVQRRYRLCVPRR